MWIPDWIELGSDAVKCQSVADHAAEYAARAEIWPAGFGERGNGPSRCVSVSIRAGNFQTSGPRPALQLGDGEGATSV